MPAPHSIIDLVERFDRNSESYKSGEYNETQTRREFIDPFFEALGWDVSNKQGYAEAYKDVIHEYSQKTADTTEAPDYLFRIGGTRKFFVEAKKPSVNLKEDIHPAYQLRRYAWSAKLPLSILTDFEELAIYDCRILPKINDKPSTARINFYTYKDYIEKWDEIAFVFSKDALLKGSFDKFAVTNKGKHGTTEVDDAFLKEIEHWRESLAKNIAQRNSSLSNRELNFSVQKTIDRIIFLRICEDRGIEEYGQLMNLQNGASVYARLLQIFTRADEKYNSGLFHFGKEKERPEAPDELTTKLSIDDKVLKEIIKNLYYPESPYEFSVLPADILGHVYEQFLGKVIRLTAGHQAKIEEKPEVKKAGGVYYTPTYIVDYIVKNTLGKLLIDSSPKQVSKLKILDPACGSGSFLIGAYQCLLEWHLNYYTKDIAEAKRFASLRQPTIYEFSNGNWKLTTAERKRILLNNIYGVDIDSQAVEVTKLSLLLKVLEGETDQTINAQFKMFRERALPDLASNIKCGNSLISSDFYEQTELNLMDDEERIRINVFDWEKEFPEIIKPGHSERSEESSNKDSGFNVVIGNPPYGYMLTDKEQNYFHHFYQHQNYQKDLYLLFLERYNILLGKKGLLGVIISNTWLQSITYSAIRKYLLNNYIWEKILHLPEKVFKAVVDTHVIIFRKRDKNEISDNPMIVEEFRGNSIQALHSLNIGLLPQDGSSINIITDEPRQFLYKKIMSSSIPLKNSFDVFNGVKPFEKGKGFPPQTEKIMEEKPFVREGKKPGKDWKPLLRGSLINRYVNLWVNDYWILYGKWLAAPRDENIFKQKSKVFVRQTGDSIIATLVDSRFIARDNLHIIVSYHNQNNLKSLVGILNSKLIGFVYSIMNPEKGEALAQVKKYHIESLPIILMENKILIYDQITSLVDCMLNYNLLIRKVETPQEKASLLRQIDITEKQIDKLVYELYGLTEEEIKIIEES